MCLKPFRLAALSLAFLPATTCVADDIPKKIVAYLAVSEEQRLVRIPRAEQAIRQAEERLRRARKGRIDPKAPGIVISKTKGERYTFPNKEVMQRHIEDQTKYIERQKTDLTALRANYPPYFAVLNVGVPPIGTIGPVRNIVSASRNRYFP